MMEAGLFSHCLMIMMVAGQMVVVVVRVVKVAIGNREMELKVVEELSDDVCERKETAIRELKFGMLCSGYTIIYIKWKFTDAHVIRYIF